MRRCAFRIAELSVTVRSHSAHVPCPRGLTVGYYAWKARPEPVHGAVTRGRAAKIQVIHRKSREAYGSPSIWDALVKQGRPVCEHRIARLMRTEGIRTKTVKQWRATTQLNHRMPVAASTRDRQFSVTRPNRVWAWDRTSVWTTESRLSLAAVLDLSSRAAIGWVLHHSDRGSQYAARAYQQLLTTQRMTGSMSRRRNCWDNPCVECAFGTLKRELIDHRQYRTRDEATWDIFE